MSIKRAKPTGHEVYFDEEDIIVSKTDLKGRITYGNDIFINISGYTEDEILGAPHNILRHPDMPACVFHLLWETIADSREIFAYVVNMCKNGDHYWVLAHVTPTIDSDGNITGYHSSRRAPDRSSIEKIGSLYRSLREEERRHGDKREGMKASQAMLARVLEEKGMTYDEFVWSLVEQYAKQNEVREVACLRN